MAGLPEEAEKLGCQEMVARLFCFSHLDAKVIKRIKEYLISPGLIRVDLRPL
jgi:hypothetical protein